MSLLSDLVARLRALLFRSQEERELDEELRFHVEMESEHLQRAGLPEDEAGRRSRIELGGIEPVKEQVRDARGCWKMSARTSATPFAPWAGIVASRSSRS
jgi:hypothetical protein